MTNLIPNPTYETFKNAISNGWHSTKEITRADIAYEFKVSGVITDAWLVKYLNELHEYKLK